MFKCWLCGWLGPNYCTSPINIKGESNGSCPNRDQPHHSSGVFWGREYEVLQHSSDQWVCSPFIKKISLRFVFLPIHSINLLAKQIKYLSQSKVSHFSGARYNHLVLCGKSQGECWAKPRPFSNSQLCNIWVRTIYFYGRLLSHQI